MTTTFGRAAAAKAAVLMTGSTYVSYALGILVSALIARDLGPQDYGRYAYAVWMVGLLVVISGAAFNTTAIRFIAESIGSGLPVQAAAVHARIRRGMWVGLVVTACVFVVVMLAAPPVPWAGHMTWFIAIVLAAFAAKDLYLFESSVAKGYGLFTVEAYSMIGVTVVNTLLVAILAWRHSGLLGYLLLFVAASYGYHSFALVLLRRAGRVPKPSAIAQPLVGRMRRHSNWTLVLGGAAALGNRSFEAYLLGQSFGSASVGFFAIAVSLTRGAIDIFTAGISTVLMPAMSQAVGRDDPERLQRILGDSIRYFAFIGLLLSGVGSLVAPPVIALMYGARYAAVTPIFRVLLLAGGLTLAEGTFGALLTTTDRQRVRATVSLSGVALNAVFAFLLVPRYGLWGAMASAALARVSYFGVLVVVISIGWGLRLPWRSLGRLGLAAALALVPALLPQTLLPGHAWLQLVDGIVFGACFLIGSVLLRAWSAADAGLLLTLLERVPRVPAPWLRALEGWRERSDV